jgi:hypothetical protein
MACKESNILAFFIQAMSREKGVGHGKERASYNTLAVGEIGFFHPLKSP